MTCPKCGEVRVKKIYSDRYVALTCPICKRTLQETIEYTAADSFIPQSFNIAIGGKHDQAG